MPCYSRFCRQLFRGIAKQDKPAARCVLCKAHCIFAAVIYSPRLNISVFKVVVEAGGTSGFSGQQRFFVVKEV